MFLFALNVFGICGKHVYNISTLFKASKKSRFHAGSYLPSREILKSKIEISSSKKVMQLETDYLDSNGIYIYIYS